MTGWLVSLDDPRASDPETVGVKSAWLARARARGLPVLPGWVVPAGAAAGALAAGQEALDSAGPARARPAAMRAPLDDRLRRELADLETARWTIRRALLERARRRRLVGRRVRLLWRRRAGRGRAGGAGLLGVGLRARCPRAVRAHGPCARRASPRRARPAAPADGPRGLGADSTTVTSRSLSSRASRGRSSPDRFAGAGPACRFGPRRSRPLPAPFLAALRLVAARAHDELGADRLGVGCRRRRGDDPTARHQEWARARRPRRPTMAGSVDASMPRSLACWRHAGVHCRPLVRALGAAWMPSGTRTSSPDRRRVPDRPRGPPQRGGRGVFGSVRDRPPRPARLRGRPGTRSPSRAEPGCDRLGAPLGRRRDGGFRSPRGCDPLANVVLVAGRGLADDAAWALSAGRSRPVPVRRRSGRSTAGTPAFRRGPSGGRATRRPAGLAGSGHGTCTLGGGPEDTTALEPGDIIVVEHPVPALAPFLWDRGGIVAASGSPGSHLCEVARSITFRWSSARTSPSDPVSSSRLTATVATHGPGSRSHRRDPFGSRSRHIHGARFRYPGDAHDAGAARLVQQKSGALWRSLLRTSPEIHSSHAEAGRQTRSYTIPGFGVRVKPLMFRTASASPTRRAETRSLCIEGARPPTTRGPFRGRGR